MKNLKTVLVAVALFAGIGASADCCVTQCCKVKECVRTVTKCVPYQACSTVCVPQYDACGCFTGYKKVKQCVTKFKTVQVKEKYKCCSCETVCCCD